MPAVSKRRKRRKWILSRIPKYVHRRSRTRLNKDEHTDEQSPKRMKLSEGNSASSETPFSSLTASERKLGAISLKQHPLAGEEGKGRRILSLPILKEGIESMCCCKICNSPVQIVETFSNNRGMISRIAVQCSNPSCFQMALLSNPYSDEARITNMAAIFSARVAGFGRASLENFTACMELLPPLSSTAFVKNSKQISVECKKISRAMMLEASDRLHSFYGASACDIIGVPVTIDGTWSHRGFSSQYGAVVVMSWDTGEVLDYHFMSKYCKKCDLYKAAHTEEQYRKWYESHKQGCDSNYEGSSGHMEVEGTVVLFKRSVSERNLMYTVMIGDGDTKAYQTLKEACPYGNDVEILKEECVVHIGKRFRKRLQALLQRGGIDSNGKRVPLTGKNGINHDTVLKLTAYFSKAIKRNQKNLECMVRDIQAIYHHGISTDDQPQHQYCPIGKESWCKYNRALATNSQPPEHKPTIPPAKGKYFKVVFDQMSRVELLKRCLLGATQNQNESFNGVIWSRAKKTSFVGAVTAQTCVDIAVAIFNQGKSVGLLRMLEAVTGTEGGPRSIASFQHDDLERIKKSRSKAAKKKRKIKVKAVDYAPALDESIDDEEDTLDGSEPIDLAGNDDNH